MAESDDEVVQLNRSYSRAPAFTPTALEQPIGMHALQLVTARVNAWHSMGTAILINNCLALTAKHIMAACQRSYGGFEERASGDFHGDFAMHAFQYGRPNASNGWPVSKIHLVGCTDLAVLQIGADPSWIPSGFPRINLNPPAMGSRVVGFGYAGKVDVHDHEVKVEPGAHTSVGEVVEVFLQGRDRAVAPFPCSQSQRTV
jgi:hypothetical protein